jgi:glycosyltransferase involved in cell wall biosynthesis
MPIRLTIVATHPIQYNTPWFQYLAANCPEIDLTVLYASRPTPAQQAVGFDTPFEWDTPLLDGYRWQMVRDHMPDASFGASSFRALDVPEIGRALMATKPDVVLVPGWHSITLVRAMLACRRRGIPVLYRGDSHLHLRPRGWRGAVSAARTRVLVRLYAAHLAVGRRARAYLLAHGVRPTSIHASPHAVDNEFFASGAAPYLTDAGRTAARATVALAPTDFGVLFVGKLIEPKRVIDAIRAVAQLGPDAALIVAGSGAREGEARAEAERLGVRVMWLGFVNQTRIAQAYAEADCIVLPSEADSWGLVINEAMATGLPAVVSDRVGCAADLVSPGHTGEVFRFGDVDDLAAALRRVRDRGGRATMAAACRATIAQYSVDRAAVGLVAACQAVVRRAAPARPRVIACCGGMVIVSGLERMTFEVLRVVRQRGGSVHCIVNTWENHRIVRLAEEVGASWSTGFYWYTFSRRTRNPIRHAQSLWDVVRTSAGLLRDAWRFRPTHVLVPEYAAVLRNAPALALLRLMGVAVVFRIANAPERGRAYDLLWGRVLPPFVTRFVPNSQFSHSRLQQTGVPSRKITLIRNAVSQRRVSNQADDEIVALAASRRTILVVGQIAPFKGTHLAVDAALQLLAEGDDIQMIVVGAIPSWPDDLAAYARALQERVRQAGVSDRVHFVGTRENVPAIMRASYVLATPILQEETFGNVALEARSVGLPVVTFDRGGLGELVTDRRTGYLCATPDLPGLLDGLRHFLTNPAERARASDNCLAAAGNPSDVYSSTDFARQWWALFARAS